jgi:protein gp37
MTKIEWADEVYNFIWGCSRFCRFCYARKYARRFAEYTAIRENKYRKENGIKLMTAKEIEGAKNFEPTFFRHKYNARFSKKPKRIFIGSMSDINFWKESWFNLAFEKIREYPQHTFIFLTKYPEVYFKRRFPENTLLGMTATKENDLQRIKEVFYGTYAESSQGRFFLNIEPIQEFLEMPDVHLLSWFEWLIIGAETGNDTRKVYPKKFWIKEILEWKKFINGPIFMKDNLSDIWRGKLIQEFPK